jgi:hypothetical protein
MPNLVVGENYRPECLETPAPPLDGPLDVGIAGPRGAITTAITSARVVRFIEFPLKHLGLPTLKAALPCGSLIVMLRS